MSSEIENFPTQVTFRCDGCAKQAPGVFARGDHNFHKPSLWFIRDDEDGPQIACSRECVEKIAKTTGKTSVKLPF